MWATEEKEHAMSGLNSEIAAIGIDSGKNVRSGQTRTL
jgi:hypothetical protein